MIPLFAFFKMSLFQNSGVKCWAKMKKKKKMSERKSRSHCMILLRKSFCTLQRFKSFEPAKFHILGPHTGYIKWYIHLNFSPFHYCVSHLAEPRPTLEHWQEDNLIYQRFITPFMLACPGGHQSDHNVVGPNALPCTL